MVRCETLPEGFDQLRKSAVEEGYGFLDRLAARWKDGRYLDDEEASLFAIFALGDPVAIGAQTVDEFEPSLPCRRMRHLYVHPDYRRAGFGRTLAGAMIQQGFELAPMLTVNATHALSRAFWESLGFQPVAHATRSHELRRTP